ncbi:hypothetical protein [Streptomyces bullii]|uniref:Knr4/Smi1-like domain-containing protein n=1 Tax=Streptomyces bullii TaxID=349910 RepID=A0ABW0UV89_9ACTN
MRRWSGAREQASLGAAAARRLTETGRYEFEPGLTDVEFARIEREFGFEFADDHRAFLAAGLPVNVPPEDGQTWDRPWPEWRAGDVDSLRRQLAGPVEGVLFDVERNGFWYAGWGERPADQTASVETARRHLAEVPVLVPVYAHRYLPTGRGNFGHPVLSVCQTDIIYYGLDLDDYIHREFGEARGAVDDSWNPKTTVPFWRDLLRSVRVRAGTGWTTRLRGRSPPSGRSSTRRSRAASTTTPACPSRDPGAPGHGRAAWAWSEGLSGARRVSGAGGARPAGKGNPAPAS